MKGRANTCAEHCHLFFGSFPEVGVWNPDVFLCFLLGVSLAIPCLGQVQHQQISGETQRPSRCRGRPCDRVTRRGHPTNTTRRGHVASKDPLTA